MPKFRIQFFALFLAFQSTTSSFALAQESAPTPPPESSPLQTYEASETQVLGHLTAIRFQGLNALPEDIVADVATLKAGESFTRRKLENSINDLRKWGVFSKVEVLVQYDDDKIELDYQLAEGFIITDVRIKGNYPLLEKRVQRVMFLNIGAIYDHEKLPEQIDRLEKLYEQEGYYGTTVLAEEDYDEEKREVSLTFRIKKGVTYRLREVDVEGNEVLNPKRIRNIIYTFSHYKPKQIKKDLQKITGLYKKRGYVRARVRLEGEHFTREIKKVDVDILVRQGPHVEVFFEGNQDYSAKKLKKQITVFEGGDFDEFELEASKKKLIRFYQERGYEEIKVEWKREKLGDKAYQVTFHVDEGPQRKVDEIAFEGNEQVKDKRLKRLMASRESSLGEKGYYLPALLEEDLKTIENYYHEEGFLEADITDWDKEYDVTGEKVSLNIEVDEGELAKVKSLAIEGMPEELRAEIQGKLLQQPGTNFSPYRSEQDTQALLIFLAEEGYPYATAVFKTTQPEPDQYDVSYQVIPGKLVRIGRLLFVGNSATRESTLRKNLRFREGDLFSTKTILQSQINLRALGIFSAVDVETLGLTAQRETVNVVIRVQEKKSKIIDFEAGYNTDTGFSGKFIFNKLNLGGMGKNANFKLQVGQEVSRVEANYVDPRFRGKSLQWLTGTYAGIEQRPFFRNKNVGAYTTLFKEFGQKLSAYGSLNLNYVNFDDDDTVFTVLDPRENPDDRTRLTTTLGVTHDSRDNYGDPHRGLYLNGTAALTNEFFQHTGNYSTLKANVGYWYSPLARFTIANALRVAQIFVFPDDTIVPPDSRLYLGGDDTVRGFKQDALLPSGGTFSLVHNLELQFRVFAGFQAVAFVDTGIVTNGVEEISLAALRHSAGLGARYITPVGPIRLDYGFILDRRETDLSSGRLHFSFGYFF